ncbi:hypothetical protein JY97_04115 [Alkalispirochaeta odontotermitis]|nr:hypothetical protein JY97_04115 [Alkalispirochaeta odontotermitis]CAB1085522.1 hypothetical protein D1AOALGA4SA_13010 [Olavius algarvensis Delta 1 endosymbiont]
MNIKPFAVSIAVFVAFVGLILVDLAPANVQIVHQIQRSLKDLGYNPGPLDGIWGQKTEQALKAFQRENGLPATGKIDHATNTKLGVGTPSSRKPLPEDRTSRPADHPGTDDALQNVGYINLQRLVNDSRMGRAARSEMQKIRREKEVLVAAKLREVNELRELINSTGDKMSPLVKQEKQLDLQKASKAYRRLVADVKEDIDREDRELVSIILQKAEGALQEVAKSMNYTIILKDASALGYLSPSVDITDDVIRVLDQK